MTPPFSPQHQMMLQQALALHQAGQLAQAREMYRRMLAVQSQNADLLRLLGTVECQLGQTAEGIRFLDKSLKVSPGQPATWHNRGNALMDVERFGDALASFDQALALRPDYAEAWFSRGNALQGLERCDEAVASYDKALAIEPGYAEGLFRRGDALIHLHRHDEALASYDKGLSLDPGHAEALSNRGVVLVRLGRLDEALASFDRAVASDPDYAEGWHNRAGARRDAGALDAALSDSDRALALRPDHAEAHYSRGLTLQALGRIGEAIASFDRAAALKPDLDGLAGQALYARLHLADWSGFHDGATRLADRIGRGDNASIPFQVHALLDSPELHRRAAEVYAAGRFPSQTVSPPRHPRHDRIRIGYFSSDFGNHPVSHLLAGMFERHDRTRFEVFAFSLRPQAEDAWRRRVMNGVEHFIDVSARSDQEIVALTRRHEIDIAVDLNGFTVGNRTGIFAGRAAPVQASYIGFLGTMGAPYIDYLLADATIIPPELDRFYTEKVVRLPSFQLNDDRTPVPETTMTRAEAGLPEAGFVFCSFNQNYKITPEVFAGWMRVLHQVPDSVLWLHVRHPVAVDNLIAAARSHGIAGDRLVFAPAVPFEAHLARQRLADLFLDSHPYNAGATASNALRMGLPVLTRIGEAFPARMGASLLNAVGLPELVTPTPEAYEALAVQLATHPERMASIRAKLAANLATCALFDTERATRAIEAAYSQMYQRSQDGLPPAAIAVTPPVAT
jgi:predicted O-linked N-acetylglucosamine transferase (SPINDLY family)